MLPRKLHLDEINRYHDKLVELRKQVDVETDTDKKYILMNEYMRLFEFWAKIDDFIEFEIKNKLDILEETLKSKLNK